MRLVLLGAPGSGKGTQAERLKTKLDVPHISTGDLLRAAVKAGTELGKKAKAVMEAGQLVSDEIVLGMLEERLSKPDTDRGFILDGYPRNLEQVKALAGLLKKVDKPLDAVIKLDVPHEEIVARTNIRFQEQGRADDNPDTVRKRLSVYAEQTAPVADWYDNENVLHAIDGVGELDDVTGRITNALHV